MPKCASTKELSPEISSNTEDSRRVEEVIEKKEQSPTISMHSEGSKIVENHSLKSFGQSCSQHSDCYSKNCISICESPSIEESRCIESEMFFALNNLPGPKCLNRGVMKHLVHDVDLSIEQGIWTRLARLRGKTL